MLKSSTLRILLILFHCCNLRLQRTMSTVHSRLNFASRRWIIRHSPSLLVPLFVVCTTVCHRNWSVWEVGSASQMCIYRTPSCEVMLSTHHNDLHVKFNPFKNQSTESMFSNSHWSTQKLPIYQRIIPTYRVHHVLRVYVLASFLKLSRQKNVTIDLLNK